MTMPRKFAKNIGWGHSDHKKFPHELFPSPLNTHRRRSKLLCHPKQINPTEASLFDIFPTLILAYILIWVSSLGHPDKFKAVVLRINSIYNPVLFTIPRAIWTPFHNFGVFCWYNYLCYRWAHRRIPNLYNGPWMR